MKMNDTMPWATIFMGVLVVLVALVGAGVVLFGEPGALSYETYAKILAEFALGIGLLGVGRGILNRSK